MKPNEIDFTFVPTLDSFLRPSRRLTNEIVDEAVYDIKEIREKPNVYIVFLKLVECNASSILLNAKGRSAQNRLEPNFGNGRETSETVGKLRVESCAIAPLASYETNCKHDFGSTK